jgi:hypothetical protein
MSAKQPHIHKFKRLTYKSGNQIFFCTLPDCSQKINPALALGKRSICWRCEEPFIMTEYSLRLAKPHCENCHKSKSDKIAESVDEMISLTKPDNWTPNEPKTLAERLQATIQQKQTDEDEI